MKDFEPNNLETTKTDPRLDALLDEALAPDAVPTGMNDRIVAATVDRLPGGSTAHASPVIGRIGGGGFPWRSVAAVLLMGGVAGMFFMAYHIPDKPNLLHEGPFPPIANVEPIEAVHLGLDQLADAALQAEPIDDRIALLSMQLSATQTPGIWERDALESLDAAIAFEEFDELHDELDLYF